MLLQVAPLWTCHAALALARAVHKLARAACLVRCHVHTLDHCTALFGARKNRFGALPRNVRRDLSKLEYGAALTALARPL
tara:strand:- start:490 stop:729 length:240 start_codon:yes stop_codon:yes gene_type:complete